jgi:hypothetical protein
MTTQVECDEAEVTSEVRVQLSTPRQPTLRKAVKKQDRAARWDTRFDGVKPNAISSRDSVRLHAVNSVAVNPLVTARAIAVVTQW